MITWAGYQMSCLTYFLRNYGSNYDFLLDVYIETAQQQHPKTQHNTTQNSNTDKFVIKTRVSIIDNHNHKCNDNHSKEQQQQQMLILMLRQQMQRCRCRCRIGSHPKNRTIEPKEVKTRVYFFVWANKDLLASKQLRDWQHNNCQTLI